MDGGPDHIEQTVQRMAELHEEHRRTVSPLRKAACYAVSTLGNPLTLALALLAVIGWVVWNGAAVRAGFKPPDPPPFALLELAATVAAFFTTLLILAAQRIDDEAARRRAQLTLQLAALTEQKIAKVIELLERERRDNPSLETREDPEAEAMAHSVDPGHVLSRIKETQDE